MSAFYNEIDPYCAQWLRNLIAAGHIAPGVVDERSIEDIAPDELRGYTQCHFFAGIGVWSHALRLAGWPDDRPVWTGSCPCQPFSQAGKGDGIADERHLWPAWFHLIRQCAPRLVFGEQVASKAALGWLDLVQADLEGAHYAIGATDLCAAGVGAPHIRQRLLFVADADSAGRAPRIEGLTAMGHGQATGADRGVGGLADTNGLRLKRQRHVRKEGASEHGELGHAGREGLEVGQESADGGRAVRIKGPAFGATEPVRGFWSGADWIACRDGKWRPVESGSFPLVDGITNRVGRLRATGNAIVAPLVAEFIQAACEAMSEHEEKAA